MSTALKIWTVTVTNRVTKETVIFLGQGTNVAEAVADGAKGLGSIFRPKSDGKAAEPGAAGGPSLCAVILPDGTRVLRTLGDFQSDRPWGAGEHDGHTMLGLGDKRHKDPDWQVPQVPDAPAQPAGEELEFA
jgi:hypothetical protein